jgi:hypothetical protein
MLGQINVDLAAPVVNNVSPEVIAGITVVLGIVVLLFGRTLYWAFIAIAGFLVGMALADQWLADKELWIRILAAVAAGVVGAVLGIFIQRLAFAIGGFFAGWYLAFAIATQMHAPGDTNIWMIAGGILGAIVAALVMDWAIIVLSSLVGAAAILSPPFVAKLGDQWYPVLFALLAVIGIVFQGRKLIRPMTPAAPAPPMRPVV